MTTKYRTKTCTVEEVETITRAELKRLSICNSEKLPARINLNGKRLWWTGIGWYDDGPLQGDEVRVVD